MLFNEASVSFNLNLDRHSLDSTKCRREEKRREEKRREEKRACCYGDACTAMTGEAPDRQHSCKLFIFEKQKLEKEWHKQKATLTHIMHDPPLVHVQYKPFLDFIFIYANLKAKE